MSSIVKYACDELSGAEIECINVDGQPWFKAKQIAQALGYSDTKQTIRTNVDDEDKKQYKHLVVTSQGGKNTPLGA